MTLSNEEFDKLNEYEKEAYLEVLDYESRRQLHEKHRKHLQYLENFFGDKCRWHSNMRQAFKGQSRSMMSMKRAKLPPQAKYDKKIVDVKYDIERGILRMLGPTGCWRRAFSMEQGETRIANELKSTARIKGKQTFIIDEGGAKRKLKDMKRIILSKLNVIDYAKFSADWKIVWFGEDTIHQTPDWRGILKFMLHDTKVTTRKRKWSNKSLERMHSMGLFAWTVRINVNDSTLRVEYASIGKTNQSYSEWVPWTMLQVVLHKELERAIKNKWRERELNMVIPPRPSGSVSVEQVAQPVEEVVTARDYSSPFVNPKIKIIGGDKM